MDNYRYKYKYKHKYKHKQGLVFFEYKGGAQ